MPSNTKVPDYGLPDTVEVSTPTQLRAIADPLRTTILDLVLERAATVAELAAALTARRARSPTTSTCWSKRGCSASCAPGGYAPSTSGTTDARPAPSTWAWSAAPGDTETPMCINGLSVAAAESVPAHEADQLYTTIRHARISAQRAAQFWERVEALIREFTQLPRSGDTGFGFAAVLYPTDHPTLPEANHESAVG